MFEKFLDVLAGKPMFEHLEISVVYRNPCIYGLRCITTHLLMGENHVHRNPPTVTIC